MQKKNLTSFSPLSFVNICPKIGEKMTFLPRKKRTTSSLNEFNFTHFLRMFKKKNIPDPTVPSRRYIFNKKIKFLSEPKKIYKSANIEQKWQSNRRFKYNI